MKLFAVAMHDNGAPADTFGPLTEKELADRIDFWRSDHRDTTTTLVVVEHRGADKQRIRDTHRKRPRRDHVVRAR